MAQTLRRGQVLVLMALMTVAGLAVFTGQAPAKDSLAPKSAGDRWLPCERWVMYHWNPIDMPAFYAKTGIRQSELFDWLRDDDHHDLAGILRHKGFEPKETVESVLAAKPAATKRTRKILAERAGRLLTQGHLAQHVFFHWFHNPSIRQNAREIFGMNSWDYARARRMGFSPADVGRLKRGYTREQTAERVVRVMKRYEQLGVKWGATTQAQADHYAERITKLADVWLDQRYHKKKPRGGLPAPTRASGKDATKRYICRDFVGASQKRDGFDSSAGASAAGVHPAFCPLELATRREILAEEAQIRERRQR